MGAKLKETEISVDSPWGKIAGIAFGDPSNPPVLVVHGKLDVCTSFRPLLNLLPPSLYYVAVDLPGCGKSSAPPRGVRYTVMDLVPTVMYVKEHFKWKQFVYIGHSLGTLIESLYYVAVDQPGCGCSSAPPRGVRYTVMDLVPTVMYVKEHFKWKQFVYIGHSLGTLIGKLYNIAYPGVITRVVELDPVPSHHTWPTTREGLRSWYHSYYGSYSRDRYHKMHGPPETAPKYTYQQAEELVMKGRGMTKEAAANVLERCLEPAGDGLYRFTYDQRMKEVTVLPFSGELLQRLYTTTTTPTFAILAQEQLDLKAYENCDFVKDENAWRGSNYRFVTVLGGHDVHAVNPGCLAGHVAEFLLKGQSKL